jgi:uncharacterized membrane protein YbhN (UPF0104 family)
MTKRPANKPGPKPPADKNAKETKEVQLPPPKPLKPRPKLLFILLLAFVIWLASILTLYFTKVYPMRYPANPPAAVAS